MSNDVCVRRAYRPSRSWRRGWTAPKLFEDFFDIGQVFDALHADWPSTREGRLGSFAVDVEETDNELKVSANLPGVEKEDLSVSLEEGNRLTISVSQSEESETENKNFLHKERWEGSAARTLTLPQGCDSEQMNAELKDGVLTLTIGKRPESKTKTITVN